MKKMKMMKTMTMKSGKEEISFKKIYSDQYEYQSFIEGLIPHDNPIKFQYHVTGLQEEIGELLKADKRWKTHRNELFNKDEKLDELSDCFITLINIAIWSDFTQDEILKAIDNKIIVNKKRIGWTL